MSEGGNVYIQGVCHDTKGSTFPFKEVSWVTGAPYPKIVGECPNCWFERLLFVFLGHAWLMNHGIIHQPWHPDVRMNSVFDWLSNTSIGLLDRGAWEKKGAPLLWHASKKSSKNYLRKRAHFFASIYIYIYAFVWDKMPPSLLFVSRKNPVLGTSLHFSVFCLKGLQWSQQTKVLRTYHAVVSTHKKSLPTCHRIRYISIPERYSIDA